ncbi:MAG: hypothetical protein IT454_01270 [Planctomycetes bacterium]|nr:hypothetical protein [Planctomycetota bacterium]
MLDRTTEEARNAVDIARQFATAHGTGIVDDAHLLIGCCRTRDSLAARVLLGCGHDPSEVCARAEARAAALPKSPASTGQLPLTPSAKRMLELALEECTALGHARCGTHHLLLGLLRSESPLGENLRRSGLERAEARRVADVVQRSAGDSAAAPEHTERRESPAASARPAWPAPRGIAGRVESLAHASACLRGNPAGEACERELLVYLPPHYDGTRRFPVAFLLASFTSHARDFLETHPWRRGVIAELDRQIVNGTCEPLIVALPDAWTRFGGSQYVDSGYLGPFARYVGEELVALVDREFATLAGRRAVVGKSSGGFGALHLALRYPGVFPVVASISGDCDFEACFGGELYACLRGLVPFGGDPARFLADFEARPELEGDRHAVLNVLAMSACYSPNPSSPLGFDLPMDARTGARIESVWRRWLAFDPLYACERHVETLRKLELLHLECGLRDEYHLQWGLRKLADKLRALGVAFDHEEHQGSHRGISQRYQLVLPKLARVLAARRG